MNKSNNVGEFFKTAQKTIVKHSPEILTGVGIAGMITTTVLAVKATPKALQLIEDAKKAEKKDDLTPAEVIKATWKCYIPAVATGVFSTACLIGANSVHAHRNTALAAAYKLSETALTEYKGKVLETIGEKKEKTIREAVSKEQIEKNPVSKNEIFITEKGNTLCYDPISGRYFKSDVEKIRKIVNDLNRQLTTNICGYISLNEFYDEVGLGHIQNGDDLGWNLCKGLIDIEFNAHVADNGEPSLVLDYVNRPTYGYSDMY